MCVCVCVCGGGPLNKVLYGEAPPRGPTPYLFIYHFFRKGTPFMYLLFSFFFLNKDDNDEIPTLLYT